jgi:hypothetical protein
VTVIEQSFYVQFVVAYFFADGMMKRKKNEFHVSSSRREGSYDTL